MTNNNNKPAEEKKEQFKYELEYDRDGCIGAGSCVAVYPEQWSLDDEGKAVFVKKEFNDNELEKNKEAAQACPVNVIHIRNKHTGELIDQK
ncbi:MAG: ferredoxin [Nanoarchaeota archaeon]